MNDPTISIITHPDARQVPIVEVLLIRLAQLREWGVGKLGSGQPEPMASLTAGILLGVQKELPHDFYQALAQTGTLHMVAASGYNVMLVAGLITALCVSWAGRRGGTLLSILGIWLYVGLSGGSPSVVRAGIMGSLTLSAYFWGRPTEAKYLLGVTVFVWGMIQPRILADIGFQLSVVATAGILYGVPILDRIFGHFGWGQSVLTSLTRALSPTLAATIATAPLILWYFGRLSPWSVAINLLLLPIVPWIMGLTALALTAALLHLTPLVSLLAWLTYGPLWYFVQVVTYGARLY
jgi:competence protein ComEC